MKRHFVTLCLLLASPLAADVHSPTLILMGGSYRTCSSLLADDCQTDQRDFPGARGAPEYRIEPNRFAEILDPAYWQQRNGAPGLTTLQAMLSSAAFEQADADTWNALLTQEQDLILSAFEQLQHDGGRRKREQVRLDGGNRPYDAALFRQLVAEAGQRSPGRKPRVAFTTSASANGFDAVDFYRELLAQAGAEPVWWPVDAALAEARFGGTGGCQYLHTLRRTAFSMLGRERVFPDLDAEQQAACANPAVLDALPYSVQGLFLDGGDQWLHRKTFFSRDGQPNPWLVAIRTAFRKGDLVVAGTSAGAAVQSGRTGMISNGTSINAMATGATNFRGSMPEGCARAKRCPIPLHEDDLTWWHGGGLDLFGNYLVDTHVAERRRELRLITLMTAIDDSTGTAPEAGIGVDETSALTLTLEDGGLRMQASGQSGAWWFERPSPRTAVGGWSVRGHYLAPGASLLWRNGRMQLQSTSEPTRPHSGARLVGGDALQPEALRKAVWNMARGDFSGTELDALGYRLTVRMTPPSRRWRGPQGQLGVTELEFTLGRP